eukprot:TRINITY_DN19911_c0_g1::TRINITY_DN19911_c0_g1_i1::g.28969::m.28969 TRINITY_DN19911_c0_g1::TRINITY_DN19911_c0_g1_i1::g.28969  ORF type:complete len:201 (+),score=48.91,sp/Q9NQM4/PIHD3_HUMAN/32.37/6e-17,PIH1/PF08190.7/5e-14 TRINITY_DN19911_c0_g1_i1:41-604(+)
MESLGGMMAGFQELEALSKLLKDADDENPQSEIPSSLISPAQIGPAAAPVSLPEEKPKDENAIWDESEIATVDDYENDPDDPRPQPEYDILYQQKLNAEDGVLGMDYDRDATSHGADSIVVKIKLPGERMQDVDLDVKKRKLVLKSKKFKLILALPFAVRDKDGKAQYFKDKEQLVVTLPNAFESSL